MLGCSGGAGMEVYDGGRRRSIVSSNMTRTGAATMAVTSSSPTGDTPEHVGVCRPRGAVERAAFAVKQLARPEPAARARSAQPLLETTFLEIRFPRGRHGGPGSRFTCGSKVTWCAVGRTAIP